MLKQGLHQKLSQKLSPQQIQLMNMIQLSSEEFEDYVKTALEENPALEPEETEKISADSEFFEYLDQRSQTKYNQKYTYEESNNSREYIPDNSVSLHEHLESQLGVFDLDEKDETIVKFLIGCIDDSGYLRTPLEDISDDLAFTYNIDATTDRISQLLIKVLQKLEPLGIGARDLRECLILQLLGKPKTPDVLLATEILKTSFDAFSKKHFEKLYQKHGATEETLKKAIDAIEKLNPRPGNGYDVYQNATEQIIPDFTVIIENDTPIVSLNIMNSPKINISNSYKRLETSYKSGTTSEQQKDAMQYIKQKLDAARGFIDAIEQRRQTLLATIEAIVNFQKMYFITGDDKHLRPMVLKDISEKTNLDISTISRVTSSKYLETPFGTKLLKNLFSEGIKNNEGTDVSNKYVKQVLKKLIDSENKYKPLTDEELVELLRKENLSLARRTVAKYREMLDIPVARLRREL